MQFEFSPQSLDSVSSDVAVVFVFEGKKEYEPTESFVILDKALSGLLTNVLKEEKFDGKEGNSLTIYTNKKILAPKVMVVGLGKKKDVTPSTLRKVGASLSKKRGKNTSTISLPLLSEKDTSVAKDEQVMMMAQGLLLGNYKFSQYQKKDENEKELEMIIFSGEKSVTQFKDALDEAERLYNAIKLARDLVNEQAAVATPTFLAKVARDIAHKNPQITCTVYDKKQAEKLGMNAFLGVARGSDEIPPMFVHLEYTPKGYKGKKKLAVVGKAITFDTGGVSLKPWQYLANMKLDMAGGAAILGLFSVIDKIAPSMPIMGIFAATPNVVSAKSYVPSDIFRAMNGKTIEIINTDAEGRVTLADSLSYAVKKGATEIIDLATLTGASMSALGLEISALYSNDEKLKKDILDAASKSGERVWEMPLVKEYKDSIKSDVADLVNLHNSPYGGSITAALFLEEFIDEKPWVHLDIAGTAFAEKEHDLGPKGGTGVGVAMLIEYLKNIKN